MAMRNYNDKLNPNFHVSVEDNNQPINIIFVQ